MAEKTTLKGSCLCGLVKVVATRVEKKVGACHCGMCRKWSGGPYMEVSCGVNVSFEGEENISFYGSSDWAERGFCKNCGSHLFYRLKETNEHMVSVGLFDDQQGYEFTNQVFIDKKPSFYSFSNETKTLTEKEIFEMYGG